MNMDAITLEDCMINFEVNNIATIMNDGHVLMLIKDEQQTLLMPYVINNLTQ